eukprot:430191_1
MENDKIKAALLIDGFVRDIEKLLSKQIIPNSIYHICFKYFFILLDEWVIGGKDVKYDKQVAIISPKHTYRSVYGKYCVLKGLHEWKIKIESMEVSVGIIFGITTQTTQKDTYFNSQGRDKHFAYAFGVSFKGEGKVWTRNMVPSSVISGFEWKKNDVVTVTVNFDDKKIEFKHNDDVVGKVNDIQTDFSKYNDDIKYRIAASGYYKDTRYRIISYKNS